MSNTQQRILSIAALVIFCFPESGLTQDSIRKGLGIFAGYNLASNIELEFQNTSETTESTYSAAGAFLLGARYDYLIADGFGVSGGLSFEFDREVSEITSGSTTVERTNDSFSVFSIEGNGYYHFYEGAFAIGGINYAMPSFSLEGDVSASGGIGLQVGGGYQFMPNLNAEILYKTQNFEVDSGSVSSNYARLWGVLLRVAYQIDFESGLDLGF